MLFFKSLAEFLRSSDNLTTIAGLLPIVLNLAQVFGVPLTSEQRSAVMESSIAVIGFFTAKAALSQAQD